MYNNKIVQISHHLENNNMNENNQILWYLYSFVNHYAKHFSYVLLFAIIELFWQQVQSNIRGELKQMCVHILVILQVYANPCDKQCNAIKHQEDHSTTIP